MSLSSFFRREPKPEPTMYPVISSPSIREQLEILDNDIVKLGGRIAQVGLSISNENSLVGTDMPPVASLSDVVEFLNTRIDVLNALVDSIEQKLGF